ncbi:hypothetical protein K474DRAFT_1711356 [Panus rudis PR-1116 ss-1]|nr:hypothetical protein K474DRAFT_1711356 [Panus rudis PR-1116 ss-1]
MAQPVFPNEAAAVSRTLLQLIDTSPLLTYKLELSLLVMVDNPVATIHLANKRLLLRRYQEHWDRWLWTPLSEDLLPHFRRLPANIRGISLRTWKVSTGFEIMDYGFDAPQNHLVAVAKAPLGSDRTYAYLMELDSGEPHREAGTSLIELPLPSNARSLSDSLNILVNRRTVSFLKRWSEAADASEPQQYIELLLCDWTTGNITCVLRDPSIHSYTYLNERHVVLSRECKEGSCKTAGITVVDTAAGADENFQPRQSVTLHSPLLGPQWLSVNTSVCCFPTSDFADLTHGQAPFYVDYKKRVLMLRVSCHGRNFRYDANDLYVLAETLFDYLPSGTGNRSVPWEEWGPPNTRLMPSDLLRFYRHPVYGSRAVRVTKDCRVNILDFNPFAHQSRGHNSAKRHSAPAIDSADSCMIAFPNVQTSLPYQVMTSNLQVTSNDAIMLSEDSIIATETAAISGQYELRPNLPTANTTQLG